MFALAVVQETLEGLDSYQDGDYSGILLRLEYLNRIIINYYKQSKNYIREVLSTK